jgi:hypothetical protein
MTIEDYVWYSVFDAVYDYAGALSESVSRGADYSVSDAVDISVYDAVKPSLYYIVDESIHKFLP